MCVDHYYTSHTEYYRTQRIHGIDDFQLWQNVHQQNWFKKYVERRRRKYVPIYCLHKVVLECVN